MTRLNSARLIEEFWTNVDRKHGRVCPNHGRCWEWRAGVLNSGYGGFKECLGQRLAHRISWTIHHGEIPQNLFVLHQCDNRLCVNPDHLWLGTQKDNIRDMDKKGRRVRAGAVGERNISAKHPEYRQGVNNGRAKIEDKDVLWIREQYAERRFTQTQLAEMFNMTQGMIGHIVRRIAWKHI